VRDWRETENVVLPIAVVLHAVYKEDAQTKFHFLARISALQRGEGWIFSCGRNSVVSFKYHSQPPAVIQILDVINNLAAALLLINDVDYTFAIGNRVRTVLLAKHNAALTDFHSYFPAANYQCFLHPHE